MSSTRTIYQGTRRLTVSLRDTIEPALKPNVIAVRIDHDTTQAVINAIPAGKVVLIGPDLRSEQMTWLPPNLGDILLNDASSIDAIRMIPQEKKVQLANATPAQVSSLPTGIRHIAIGPNTPLATITVIRAGMILYLGNVSSEQVAAIPNTMRTLVLCSATRNSSISHLPQNTPIALWQGTTEQQVRLLPSYSDCIRISSHTPLSALTGLAAGKRVMLASCTPVSHIQAIVSEARNISYFSSLPIELISIIPTHKRILLNAGSVEDQFIFQMSTLSIATSSTASTSTQLTNTTSIDVDNQPKQATKRSRMEIEVDTALSLPFFGAQQATNSRAGEFTFQLNPLNGATSSTAVSSSSSSVDDTIALSAFRL